MSNTEIGDDAVASLAEHGWALALEAGQIEDHASSPPERGAEAEIEWSIDDVGDWDADPDGDGELVLTGEATGSYQVKTADAVRNPPGRAHPAEYENRELDLAVSIRLDPAAHDGLGDATAVVEPL